LADFEAAGVRPVAISVDSPEISRNLAIKSGFTFPILSDPGAVVIRRYHILHPAGAPDEHDIARPAEFLVDSSKTVRWANFTEDIRVRARADDLLHAARQLR
jgi:peroxiredoxin